MTIQDIAKVTWTITTLDITARDESGQYLHRWIIGEGAAPDNQPVRTKWDWRAGRISLFPRKINAHNDEKSNGQPDMGWGLKNEAIPGTLLNAEITRLSMRCSDGITYRVTVDVIISSLEVEMLKAEEKNECAE